MRCHYEVLGVSRDADDAEVKRNYRKLALQYHPDKNPDNLEECTRIFHELQSAYEVLSDKKERAWYDKYRESILRGGDDFVDDALDLWHYFQPSVFTGYNDEPQGFYTVFRDVFKKISEEDEPYIEDEDEYDVPDFGDSSSDYNSVVKMFYSYWLGYCTKKSYVWVEKYDLKQAPNRPTQRLMEKENKKFRDAARRKRNEEVRGLVAYVRKRDKRVQAYRKQLETKNAENQRKLEKKREEDIRRNNQLLDDYEGQEWMAFDHSKLDSIDSHFDEMFGNVDASDMDDEQIDNFYCIACDKNFKSEKALVNHENSKKHKENVEMIKNELAEDLEDLQIDKKEENGNEETSSNLTPEFSECEHSLSLQEKIVKRNEMEKLETPPEYCKDKGDEAKSNHVDCYEQLMAASNGNDLKSCYIRHTDSLIYAKMKGPNISRGSIKMKEKKKKGKMADDVFDSEQEWMYRHDHLNTSLQDSLFMPRKKTKKQELKEVAERVRIDIDHVPINDRDASLGKSSITNSLKLVKRPTKASRKKGRRKLLDIEENDDIITFTAKESNEENISTNDGNIDEYISEEGNGTRLPLLQPSIVIDSIQYNKDQIEHSGKSLITQKYEAALKKEDEENTDDVNFLGGDVANEPSSSPLLSHRSLICDSIRYNKDHIEHKGKHILTQKSEEKINPESREGLKKQNKKGKSDTINNESFSCHICSKQYPTRNKLFEHIKADGHAVLKEATSGKKEKKGKGKK